MRQISLTVLLCGLNKLMEMRALSTQELLNKCYSSFLKHPELSDTVSLAVAQR